MNIILILLRNNHQLILAFSIFATSAIIQPSNVYNQLHEIIDWNNLEAELSLNSLEFRKKALYKFYKAMPALPIAIALLNFELAQRLIDHGANPDHGYYGIFRDNTFLLGCNVPRERLIDYNTRALHFLLKNGAKTDNSVMHLHPLYDEKRVNSLKKYYKNNDYFDMKNPATRQIVKNTLLGQIIQQTHKRAIRNTTDFEECTAPLTESTKKIALLKNQEILNSRNLLKQFLTDESIPSQTRKKIISLFQPYYKCNFLDRNLGLQLNDDEESTPAQNEPQAESA